MALPLSNSFETGIATGTAITVANSDDGSAGNAFDVVLNTAGTTFAFDSTQAAHGTLSAKVVQHATTPVNLGLKWTSSLGGNKTELWGRFYLRFPAIPPTTAARVLRLYNTALTLQAAIQLNPTFGALQIVGSGANGNSTAALSVNTWYRIEWHWIQGSPGTFELRVYAADSEVLFSSATNTDINMGTGTDEVWMGQHNGSTVSFVLFLDDPLVNATGWPGPVTFQFLRPSADSVDGAWVNELGVATNLYASVDESATDPLDYISSEIAPSASAVRLKISTGTTPQAGTKILHSTLSKDVASGAQIDFTLRVYECSGGSCDVLGAGTLRDTFTHTDVPDTPTDYADTMTGSYTNWANLYVEIEADQV